jgi:hypothetical protein
MGKCLHLPQLFISSFGLITKKFTPSLLGRKFFERPYQHHVTQVEKILLSMLIVSGLFGKWYQLTILITSYEQSKFSSLQWFKRLLRSPTSFGRLMVLS